MPSLGLALGLPYGRKAAAGFTGALDAYQASLTSSWSLCRRLFASYTGDLIRVRRSGDNAEANFGALANGTLDTSALVAWVVAGGGTQHGHVVTVFDQLSGAPGNLGQATAARQPRIVISGALQSASDGRPCAIYTAGANSLVLTYSRAAGNLTAGSVATTRSSTTGQGQSPFVQSGYLNGIYPQSATSPFNTKALFVGAMVNGGTYVNNNREVSTYKISSTTFTYHCGSVIQITTTNGGASRALANPVYGAGADDGWASMANWQEGYLALSALSDATINALETALT